MHEEAVDFQKVRLLKECKGRGWVGLGGGVGCETEE